MKEGIHGLFHVLSQHPPGLGKETHLKSITYMNSVFCVQ
jgi:hypothetical protein